MNYLDLVNAVLVRLRENPVTTADFQSTPYYRMIGAAVNDAKHIVEQSWKWSQLRSVETYLINQGDDSLTLTNSADRVYQVFSVLNQEEGYYLRWVTEPWLKARNRNNATTPVNPQKPFYYGFGLDDPSTGNKTLTLFAPSNAVYHFDVSYWAEQNQLANWDDRLLTPSLPVYSLATALAARERGEVGGAPTSELFALADKNLSDAIAYDSSRFPEEMDWYSPENYAQTNVRSY